MNADATVWRFVLLCFFAARRTDSTLGNVCGAPDGYRFFHISKFAHITSNLENAQHTRILLLLWVLWHPMRAAMLLLGGGRVRLRLLEG